MRVRRHGAATDEGGVPYVAVGRRPSCASGVAFSVTLGMAPVPTWEEYANESIGLVACYIYNWLAFQWADPRSEEL